MKRGVTLFAMVLFATLATGQTMPAGAPQFLALLEEAHAATRFEDRLRKHERALEAILKSDADALEAVLALWAKDVAPKETLI